MKVIYFYTSKNNAHKYLFDTLVAHRIYFEMVNQSRKDERAKQLREYYSAYNNNVVVFEDKSTGEIKKFISRAELDRWLTKKEEETNEKINKSNQVQN